MYTTFLVSAAFYLANALLTGALCEVALRAWKNAYLTKEDPAQLTLLGPDARFHPLKGKA
jgi:hypothetical protein